MVTTPRTMPALHPRAGRPRIPLLLLQGGRAPPRGQGGRKGRERGPGLRKISKRRETLREPESRECAQKQGKHKAKDRATKKENVSTHKH